MSRNIKTDNIFQEYLVLDRPENCRVRNGSTPDAPLDHWTSTFYSCCLDSGSHTGLLSWHDKEVCSQTNFIKHTKHVTVTTMSKLMARLDSTYLSYDPEIKVCASNGWNFKVWTWKIIIFSSGSTQHQDHSLYWIHSDPLHTLSVCLRRVVAGLPWERSHKITVSSADPLANTFLTVRNAEFALSE